MKLILTESEKQSLEILHRSERDGHIKDRIKSVLLRYENWSIDRIAQALRLSKDTVRRYIDDYKTNKKISHANGGSEGKLNTEQTNALIMHLENTMHQNVAQICAHVSSTYQVVYSVSGMTAWLHDHAFSYKEPKEIPAKADAEKQSAFIESYRELKEKTPANEVILFMDAAHPTMATKVSRGWIRTGKEKVVLATASRTRMNIVGAININTMNVVNDNYETVNTESMMKFLDKIKLNYPDAPCIHIILDNGGYHRSEVFNQYAIEHGFKLHFLPPYSPNLNPIERLWKIMNEEVRNNCFFKTPKDFRDALNGFFNQIIPNIIEKLRSRITDNFQVLNVAG